MEGRVDGSQSRVKDCLQQSKIGSSPMFMLKQAMIPLQGMADVKVVSE